MIYNDISLKILHQAGFETARQAATLTKLLVLTIAPGLSLYYDYIINMVKHLFVCFTETVVTTTDGRRLVETHDITGKLQSRPLEGSALGFVGDYKPDLQVGQVRPYLFVGES